MPGPFVKYILPFENVARAVIADGKPASTVTGKMEQIPLPLIEHRIEASAVTIDQRANDGYVNATAMCQAAKKQMGHYFELKSTKEFLDELSSDIGIPISELVQIIKGGNPREHSYRNRNGKLPRCNERVG